MIAYKAFDKSLRAVRGKGSFQFELGKTYEESECKCAENGFHCAENPLDCLRYYSEMSARFFIVEAAGDINQDGAGTRISCTRLTLKKEINRIQLAAGACLYMEKYPDRKWEGEYAKREEGRARRKGDFIIARGKHPAAAGVKGSYLFLIQEEKLTNCIKGIYPIEVDGEQYREDTYYHIRRGRVCKRKN